MSRFHTLLALAGTATAAALALSFAPAAGAATGGYVALGDSYSSGVGAVLHQLQRLLRPQPQRLPGAVRRRPPPELLRLVACSGAKTTDVNSNQLSALSS